MRYQYSIRARGWVAGHEARKPGNSDSSSAEGPGNIPLSPQGQEQTEATYCVLLRKVGDLSFTSLICKIGLSSSPASPWAMREDGNGRSLPP